MNATATIVVSVLAAAAAATGVHFALAEQTSSDGPRLAAIESRLAELLQTDQQLRERIDSLPTANPTAASAPLTERTAAPVLDAEQVGRAVEAYLLRREGKPAEALAANGVKAEFDVEAELDTLLGSNYWDDAEAWKRAFAAGKMDEVIDAMKARVSANPSDVGAKMDLANAYLSYLQMDNSKWEMSQLADQQFDDVLAIDGQHWEARFSKAVSYTFWPEFTGKRREAITHFETLLEQQAAMPPQPHHAQTYLFLGNMLVERDPERARKVWQQGLTRHPNSGELREKIGG